MAAVIIHRGCISFTVFCSVKGKGNCFFSWVFISLTYDKSKPVHISFGAPRSPAAGRGRTGADSSKDSQCELLGQPAVSGRQWWCCCGVKLQSTLPVYWTQWNGLMALETGWLWCINGRGLILPGKFYLLIFKTYCHHMPWKRARSHQFLFICVLRSTWSCDKFTFSSELIDNGAILDLN